MENECNQGELNIGTTHFGEEEGDVCDRGGCDGVLRLSDSDGCTCHISFPPCHHCMEVYLFCPKCLWDNKE